MDTKHGDAAEASETIYDSIFSKSSSFKNKMKIILNVNGENNTNRSGSLIGAYNQNTHYYHSNLCKDST